MVVTQIFLLFSSIGLATAAEDKTCDSVAQEMYSCWYDNQNLHVHFACMTNHEIAIDKVTYLVSDNSCPTPGQLAPVPTTHCMLDELAATMKVYCDGQRTCTQVVTKVGTEGTQCQQHSGSHYMALRYYCIPNFDAISARTNIREISMCESSEWSGYYAHILSHDGANDGTFTTDIGCYCKIIKYPGTELEIRSLDYKSTKHESTCTHYVQIQKENGFATSNICKNNQVYWNLHCDEETKIDLRYLTHDRSIGVNYKIAIQVALGQMFSVACGIPDLRKDPTTTPNTATSPTGTKDGEVSKDRPSTSEKNTLFGVSMLAGIAIIVAVAVVLLLIVIVAVYCAVRARKKPSRENSYRDLVEESRPNGGIPPAVPPRTGTGAGGGAGGGEAMRGDATTGFDNASYIAASPPPYDNNSTYSGSTYGRLGPFNHLPEVSEVRMSDIEKKMKL